MGISSGVGLISGIDTESLISQLTAANRRPIQIIQQRQSVMNKKVQAYAALSSKLTELKDQLRNLLEPEDFVFRTAASSNDSALGVSADKTASPGAYSVKVLQLAQSSRFASQGVAGVDSPIASASGALTVQTGSNGAVRNYAVSATTTLADLRDAINRDASGDAQASIINDGSPTNPYRLVLTSKKTGLGNAVRILNNDTTLDFANKIIEAAAGAAGNSFNGTVASSGAYTGSGTLNIVARVAEAGGVDGASAAKFAVSLDGGVTFGETLYTAQSAAQDVSGGLGVQIAFGAGTANFAVNDRFTIDAFDPALSSAQDAVLSVDGIQVTRGDNTFNDVVPGLSFTAKAAGAAPITVTVANETGLMTAEIIKFQSAYNSLVKTMGELGAYDAKSNVAQPLFSDSALRGVQRALATLVTDAVPGLGGKYNTLASLGMKLQADGTLSYNVAAMNEALEADFASVSRIFGKIAVSGNSQVQVAKTGAKSLAGTYQANITATAARAEVLGNQALRAGGLAMPELLTFTYDSKTFVLTLDAGDTIGGAVSKLNAEFAAQGVALEAANSNGALRLQSAAYGSAASFTVTSDRAGDSDSQLGVGVTTRSAAGADVAGTINGSFVSGVGQTLKGAVGTNAEGLELLVTAIAPTTATITLTAGLSDRMLGAIEQYVNETGGVIKTRRDGLNDSILNLSERIATMENRIASEATRMRKQFAAMEKQLSVMQGMGDYVAKAIASLQSTKNS